MEGSKEKSDGNSAVEKQQKRTEELFKKLYINGEMHPMNMDFQRVRNLCQKHSELIDDFEVVKELNTAIADRFNLVVDKFPLTPEIDFLIDHIEEVEPVKEIAVQRKLILQSFRKIIVALDQHNENIRPKSYEESVESKEVKSDE